MRIHQKRGVTLIELMVAVVVSGMLMTALVGLSSGVQRSAGWTKDYSDLQSNLRFAMKALKDDISRVSYMASPNPSMDIPCHFLGSASLNEPAIWMKVDDPNGPLLGLRGNFNSSQGFKVAINSATQMTVLCHNSMPYDSTSKCAVSGVSGVPYLPFGYNALDQATHNKDMFKTIFKVNRPLVLNLDNKYQYFTVQNPQVALLTFNVLPAINRDNVHGNSELAVSVNTISVVIYQLRQDTTYVAPYSGLKKYDLHRVQDQDDRIVAEFLLSFADAAPGFDLKVIRDNNMVSATTFCQPPVAPSFGLAGVPAANNNVDPQSVRALVITLRGRTAMEDPKFTIPTYESEKAASENFGIDLDGNSANGLAHVRSVSTTVELRNLAIDRGI